MELLQQLYKIHSPSGHEEKMRDFLCEWIKRNVPQARIKVDTSGNILVTRGKATCYPCVVAHIDQVQHIHSKDFTAYYQEDTDMIFGYSKSGLDFEGLGADDKNGIWVALKCMMDYATIKIAFFVSEEVGCIGSSRVDMQFFEDCGFVIQADRKGCSDLITVASDTDLCSKEFIKDLGAEQFGFLPAHGLLTDVLTLKERGLAVSCVNVSCGYYNPHTDNEFTIFNELENTLSLISLFIYNHGGKRYPHKAENPYRGWYDWDDDPNYLGEDCFFEDDCYSVLISNPSISRTDFCARLKEQYPQKSKREIKKMYNQIKSII